MKVLFEDLISKLSKTKYYLILANILLVFFLIVLSNTGVLPFRFGDFIFFSLIYFIFALYRPGWSFLFFIGTIALENINLAPESLGIMIRPFQLIGAITIVSLLLRYFAKRLNFKLVSLKWFDYVLFAFAVAGFISMLGAADKGAAFKQSIILATFVAFYWLVRNYIQNLNDLKRIIPFFLGSSIVIVFYGIWQNIQFVWGRSSFEVMPGRPNATFAEADWLGIYLVILMAVTYTIIFYISKSVNEKESLISNDQFPISKQIPNPKLENLKLIQDSKFEIQNSSLIIALCYTYLISVYIVLVLTVSRSAWLGAGFVTLVFLKGILTHFSFKFREWQWKELLKQLAYVAGAALVSIGAVYIFHLTNFELSNRAQSTGTGLQKITIACDPESMVPDEIKDVNELAKYNCRHINLEDVETEKENGYVVKEIYRADPNVSIRSEIYRKSIEQIKAHPIFGIGWGNISQILGKDERGAGLNSSNIFLEVWLGSGILGLIAFLSIWVYIFIKSVVYCVRNNWESKTIGLFLILGFFAFLIPNLFNAGVFLGILWVWMGTALSLNTENN